MELLAHEGFGEDGLFEPLGLSPAEVQQWLDRELASFVENRFGAVVDLDALTPELRANWTARVLAKDEGDFVSPHAPGAHRKAF